MTDKTKTKDVPVFTLEESSDLPLWVQIRDRFVYLISSGYYKVDDQLPSVRFFSTENRVSCSTVAKSYMALEREGYIVTRHGSGVYVRGMGETVDVGAIEMMTEEFVKSCLEKGMDYEDIPQFISKAIKKLRNENEQ